MYESLTAFIEKLDTDDYGTWYVDKENDGSAEHPIQLPFVIYGHVVHELVEAIYRFVDEHKEMMLTGYDDTLEANGISWNTQSMTNADVSVLDGQAVIALLVGAVRAERFCDGALLEFLENGSIKRWLERLRELEPDENSIERLISKTAEYIIGLPDGTEISVEQVSREACGFDTWDVGNSELLRACSEIKERVRQTGVVLDFSKHEGELTGLSFRDKFVVRQH